VNARRLTMAVAGLLIAGALLIALGLTPKDASPTHRSPWGLLGQSSGSYVGDSLVSRNRSSDGKTESLTYRWVDPWSLRHISWLGDTPTVDNSRERHLSLTATVAPAKVQQAIDSFGYASPSSLYGTEEELRRRMQEMTREAGAKGILIEDTPSGFTVGVDYAWTVSRSRDDLLLLAGDLASLTKRKGYKTQRELLGVMASFVQSMTYATPPASRTDRSGQQIDTCEFTMPLETLYNGWGDCDSKSALFASLAANIPDQRIIFLIGNSHLFVGVRGTPRLNDHYVNIRGIKYVLIEMTTPWPVGRIAQSNRRNMGQFESLEVVGPSVRRPAPTPPTPPRPTPTPQVTARPKRTSRTPPTPSPPTTARTERTSRTPPAASTKDWNGSGHPDNANEENSGAGIIAAQIVIGLLLLLGLWAIFAQFRPSSRATRNRNDPSPLQVICSAIGMDILGEYRRYCDSVARLWAVNREPLGETYSFEIGTYLLYQLSIVMTHKELLPEIRRSTLSTATVLLFGPNRPDLRNIVNSRSSTYSEAMRKPMTARDRLTLLVTTLRRNLAACPDSLDKLTAFPPRMPIDPVFDAAILDGLLAIETDRIHFYAKFGEAFDKIRLIQAYLNS
jgi:hypothetical protein